jgi:branched-chain amino acid transport system substrate-binding protein
MSRRNFLRGTAAAGAGGLVVGGGVGYAVGNSGSESSSGSGSKDKITIGSASPITGPFAGDGRQMVRGQELAIEQINAAGGVGGRELVLVKVDTKDQSPDVMKTAVQSMMSKNVAALFMPFCSYTSVEYPILAQKKVPTFHVNTWHGNVDWVRENKATNVFQGDPTEQSYGSGFIATAKTLMDAGAWTPTSESIYVVTSNDPYSLAIAEAFRDGMEQEGWQTQGFEQFTVPQAEWGGVLVKIRDANPGIVFFSDYAAGDEAAFIKQFRESPTQSLVYQQYAPSVPEYLELAGDSADGVLWSTVVGVLAGDPIAQRFIDAFTEKFGTAPGFSNAGDQYDLVKLWAQAAAMAGDPYNFDAVNANLRKTVYRGVCGAYSFDNDGLTCIAYPDDTADPSVGMPHLTFQIQGGKQVVISPDPYSTGEFQLPEWLA